MNFTPLRSLMFSPHTKYRRRLILIVLCLVYDLALSRYVNEGDRMPGNILGERFAGLSRLLDKNCHASFTILSQKN